MLATNQMLILKFTIGINEPEETDQNAKEFQVASPVPSGQAIPMTMAPVQMYNPYGNQVYAVCVCVLLYGPACDAKYFENSFTKCTAFQEC